MPESVWRGSSSGGRSDSRRGGRSDSRRGSRNGGRFGSGMLAGVQQVALPFQALHTLRNGEAFVAGLFALGI